MVRQPMARDALSIAEPNFFLALHVIYQFRQRTDASRAADDSSMQPDAHHARMTFASSSIKPIEGIAAILKKMLAGGEICAALQAAVVAIEAVRDDEMRPVAHPGPIGDVVIVSIAVI
jgi:hypothetical protein